MVNNLMNLKKGQPAVCLLVLLLGVLSFSAWAQQPVGFGVRPLAGPFDRPVYMTHAGDGSGRLFLILQRGVIKVLDRHGAIIEETFLDYTDRLSTDNEQGLLSMAFHPNFTTNRIFYLSYTDLDGDSVISEFRVSADNPNVADTSTERVILTFEQDFSNHNGGLIKFGPQDGMLYLAFGDGGSQMDPNNRAQSLDTFMGKILRIDVDSGGEDEPYVIPPDNPFVDTPGARGEIWAYGFRNPWRFSFDRETGTLWCGDVGQTGLEEVSIVTAGANMGWKIMEGNICHDPPTGCDMTGIKMPEIVYPHNYKNGGFSVTGGYVYRGSQYTFQGTYFYADFVTGYVWSHEPGSGFNNVVIENLFQERDNISSFAEDEDGELYVLYLGTPNPNTGFVMRVTGPPNITAGDSFYTY
jgi:glucose/arabinose dehydrogenase